MIQTFRIEGKENFTRIFRVFPLDAEGYREVFTYANGSLYWYGDWNPEQHPTFQDWINYIFRPGSIEVVEEVK